MNRRSLSVVLLFTLLCIIANQSSACPNPKPIPIISGSNPRYVCKGADITFDGSPSYDPDGGPIQQYKWGFPDGTHFTNPPVQTYTYKFNAEGEYDVKLWVKDNEGQWSTVCYTCKVKVSTADIEFTLQNEGVGKVKISYTTHHGIRSRSIALRVGLITGTVQGPSDVQNVHTAYNCFMDYAHDNSSYQPGSGGHPLAKDDGPGVPSFPVSTFSINMSCFDNSQLQNLGSADPLIRLQLHKMVSGPTTTDVTVSEDILRSSFAGYGLTTNLPQTVTVSGLIP